MEVSDAVRKKRKDDQSSDASVQMVHVNTWAVVAIVRSMIRVLAIMTIEP